VKTSELNRIRKVGDNLQKLQMSKDTEEVAPKGFYTVKEYGIAWGICPLQANRRINRLIIAYPNSVKRIMVRILTGMRVYPTPHYKIEVLAKPKAVKAKKLKIKPWVTSNG
jgi:hypothetical protein